MDILFVLRRGRRFTGSFADIVVRKKTPSIPTEVKVVVSRKISKKSVIRHRIQRRLREIARITLKVPEKGLDIVFFAKEASRNSSFQKLREEVAASFKQVLRNI